MWVETIAPIAQILHQFSMGISKETKIKKEEEEKTE